MLAERGNDLTGAAISLVPEIGHVLDAIAAAPGCLMARMSGSGASCFGLFAAAGRRGQGGGLDPGDPAPLVGQGDRIATGGAVAELSAGRLAWLTGSRRWHRSFAPQRRRGSTDRWMPASAAERLPP